MANKSYIIYIWCCKCITKNICKIWNASWSRTEKETNCRCDITRNKPVAGGKKDGARKLAMKKTGQLANNCIIDGLAVQKVQPSGVVDYQLSDDNGKSKGTDMGSYVTKKEGNEMVMCYWWIPEAVKQNK